MRTFIIALIAVLAVSNAAFLTQEGDAMYSFLQFVKEHNKEYNTVAEFQERFAIFQNNLSNVESNSGSFSPFMDLTHEEFSSRLTLDMSSFATARSQMKTKTAPADFVTEESFDWREKGAVSGVKNQGQCGSCWAFSAVGSIEGQTFIKHQKLTTLSEQQLVDCDHNGDQGCNGGLMDNAFQYLINAGGIETDSDYKYTARGSTCKFDKSKAAVQVTSFFDVSKNEDEISKVLQSHGPLSVAVNATPFQFYSGGILKPTTSSCNPSRLNHGVTLVGQGVENGVSFWIIKNSWGTGWGEKGYIRLQKGTGACGVNTAVSTVEIN